MLRRPWWALYSIERLFLFASPEGRRGQRAPHPAYFVPGRSDWITSCGLRWRKGHLERWELGVQVAWRGSWPELGMPTSSGFQLLQVPPSSSSWPSGLLWIRIERGRRRRRLRHGTQCQGRRPAPAGVRDPCGSRSSTSSRASTILDGGTRHSAISRRSSSSVRRQPEPGFARVDPLRGRVSQGLQEKNQRESTMNARVRSQALRCPSKRGSSNVAAAIAHTGVPAQSAGELPSHAGDRTGL